MQKEPHSNQGVIVWCCAVTYTWIFSGCVQTLGKTACLVALQFCTVHTVKVFSTCGRICQVCVACEYPKEGETSQIIIQKAIFQYYKTQKHTLEGCRYVLEIWGQNKSNNVVSSFSSDFLMWFFFFFCKGWCRLEIIFGWRLPCCFSPNCVGCYE